MKRKHIHLLVASLLLANVATPAFAQVPMLKLLSRTTLTPQDNAFGASVALSNSFLVVGEPAADELAGQVGAVSLFSGSTGSYLRKLKATDGASADGFGGSVAISGNRVLVGASGDDDQRGAAYVFDATTGRQLRKLVATTRSVFDSFGDAVALNGNLALVGATGYASGLGSPQGAAYLFDINTGVQLAILRSTGGSGSEYFGTSVALTSQLAVIGAPGKNADQGAAYVFDIPGRTQLKRFQASDGASYDQFGRSVSLFGNIVLIGAPGADSDKGAAYLFSVQIGTQLRRFTAFDGVAGDVFGTSVSLTHDIAVIGAPDNALAYLFEVKSGTILTIISSDSIISQCGGAVAVSGNQVLIGDSAHGSRALNAGAAYFIRNQMSPLPLQYVAAKGNDAPGAGVAKFGTLSPPVISSAGPLAYMSTLTGTGAGTGGTAIGMWRAAGGSSTLVGRGTSTAGPGPGFVISSLKVPVYNDDTQLVFQSILKPSSAIGPINDSVLLASDAGAVPNIIAQEGSAHTGLDGLAVSSFNEVVQDYDYVGHTAASIRCKSSSVAVTAASDTGVILTNALGSPVSGVREGKACPLGSDIRYGQMDPHVSIMNQSIMWSAALVPGPTTPTGALYSTTSRALFRKAVLGSEGVVARAGDVASTGANYSTFLAFSESYDNQPTYKVTLSGPAVTTATNEGIYRYGLGQVWRKGDLLNAAEFPGVKITRILKFWPLRHGQVILLAGLSGTGVSTANDVALVLANPYDRFYVLLREGDYTEGSDGAKIGVIQKVDVEPVGSQYVVLASLSGSTATNQALFTGRTTDSGPSPINPRLARAGMKLRKGTLNDTGFPGLLTGVSTKIASMSITTSTDTAGAGAKGLGQAINDGGTIGLIIDYSNRLREIRSGVP